MLEFIRRRKILTQIILLVFIVPSFIFVGVEGYQRMGNSDAVAKVSGTHISQQEWEQAQREQADELRKSAGPQFDPKLIESPEFKWAVLENMIAERVIAHEIKNSQLTIDEQIVLQKIREIPGLMTPEGQLDEKRYKEALAAKGMTAEMHFNLVYKNLVQQQIGAPLQYSVIVPSEVVGNVVSFLEQEREVQKLPFNISTYRPKVTVTDEEMLAFYNENPKFFTIPEHVDAEIVVLDMASVFPKVTVSDADVKAYYDQNAARFSKPEERRVSHILIAAGKNASEAEQKAAKEKAEGILQKIKENPQNFAALAKEFSQDPGSAQNGGDLGYFVRGRMVKPFDDAAFSLKKGELSDLVKTDFGYHILSVKDIKPSVTKPLAEIKNQVMQEIKGQLANKKYTESAELFSNMVYEQPTSLQPVADKLGLKTHKLNNLTREQDPNNKHPLLSNQKFMQAIFSEEVVKNKHNTEAIEIGPQVMVSGRITKHYPAKVRPFEEVKKAIQERLSVTKAAEMAAKDSEKQLQELQAGASVKGFSASSIVSRQQINATGRMDLIPVMQANVEKLPAYVQVQEPQGYAIYRINKVKAPEKSNPQLRQMITQEYMGGEIRREMTAYVNYLKQDAKVEVLKKREEVEKAAAEKNAAAKSASEQPAPAK